MVRFAVISWLVFATLFGPALCCCSFRAASPIAPTPEPAEPSCPFCAAATPTESPTEDAPRPSSCPCRHASQVAAVPADARVAIPEPSLAGVVELASSSPVLSDSADLAPANPTHTSPSPSYLSTSARLSLMQLLRC